MSKKKEKKDNTPLSTLFKAVCQNAGEYPIWDALKLIPNHQTTPKKIHKGVER